MKKQFFIYLLVLYFLFSCTTNRYYYVAEEKMELYEFPSFSGEPVLVVSAGDTVSATGTEYIQLGGEVPVEYAGYSFYSPNAKAKFLYIRKINKKRDAMVPGVAYAARMQYNEKYTVPANESAPDNVREWYGQVTSNMPVLKEPYALSKVVNTLPLNTVVRIKRYDYNYWEIEFNGMKGYVGAFSILDYSYTESPFVKTAYTGPTYHPDELSSPSTYRPYRGSSSSHSNYGYTPSTGAIIHVGPKGGQFYVNSKGNKIYLKRDSQYRVGASSIGSSYKYKSSSNGSSYRKSGYTPRSYSVGKGRR